MATTAVSAARACTAARREGCSVAAFPSMSVRSALHVVALRNEQRHELLLWMLPNGLCCRKLQPFQLLRSACTLQALLSRS